MPAGLGTARSPSCPCQDILSAQRLALPRGMVEFCTDENCFPSSSGCRGCCGGRGQDRCIRLPLERRAGVGLVENGVLRLLVPGEPPPGAPRCPQKIALAETPAFRRVTVEAEVRRAKRSLIIVYAWQGDFRGVRITGEERM
jgi:hypothetical protein